MPTDYAFCYMLSAYKTGYYCLRNNGSQRHANDTINLLKNGEYVNVDKDTSPLATLMTLTDKGAQYVRDNFMTFLSSAKVRHIYPILEIDDEIIVSKDLENGRSTTYLKVDPTGIKPSPNKIPAGTYKVKKIDRYTLLLVPPDSSEKYRVLTYDCRDFLSLNKSNLGKFDEEFTRRIGRLNMKELSNKLLKVGVDSFKVVEIVDAMKVSPVAKDRWGK